MPAQQLTPSATFTVTGVIRGVLGERKGLCGDAWPVQAVLWAKLLSPELEGR